MVDGLPVYKLGQGNIMLRRPALGVVKAGESQFLCQLDGMFARGMKRQLRPAFLR